MLKARTTPTHPHKGFFRVVSTEEARARLAEIRPVGTESVAVAQAAGRVLARKVASPIDLPHFDRAVMDGYAVRSADTFGASESQPAYLRLVGTIEMGQEARDPLPPACAARIATGGMLPPEADAVVMVEYTEETPDGLLEVRRSVAPWENVQRVGEDVRRGTLLFEVGHRLRPIDLGALTGVGITQMRVFRRPRVALLCTGDEIVSPEVRPRPGQVRNVNEYSLLAMIEQEGAKVTNLGIVRDSAPALRGALEEAIAHHDAVLLSGGSSVGAKDVALAVLMSFPRSKVRFHGISVAPGKPTLFALCSGKPVLGLPGHPQSALVIFQIFGAPFLRILGGERPEFAFRWRARTNAVLAQGVPSQPGREDYVRVRLHEQEGTCVAVPVPGKSASVFNLIHADGLIRIPAHAEGLEAGSPVEVLLLR